MQPAFPQPSPTPSLIHAWNKCSDVPRWQLGTRHSTAAGQHGQALSTVPTVHQKAVGSAGSPLPCSTASPFPWLELLFGCRNPKCRIYVAFFRAPSALDLCFDFFYFYFFLFFVGEWRRTFKKCWEFFSQNTEMLSIHPRPAGRPAHQLSPEIIHWRSVDISCA